MAAFIFSFKSMFSQVEFFNNNNGVSCNYLHSTTLEGPGIDLFSGTMYFKNGFAAGLGLQVTEDYKISRFAIGYYGKQNIEKTQVRTSIGLSFGFYDIYKFITLDIGVYKVFKMLPDYPFILQGIISPQFAIATGRKNTIQLVPVFGLQYTQAFFTNHAFYPFVGIGGMIELFENTPSLILQAGFNIRLETHT